MVAQPAGMQAGMGRRQAIKDAPLVRTKLGACGGWDETVVEQRARGGGACRSRQVEGVVHVGRRGACDKLQEEARPPRKRAARKPHADHGVWPLQPRQQEQQQAAARQHAVEHAQVAARLQRRPA